MIPTSRRRLAIVVALSLLAGVARADEAPLRRIAFGSCNAQQLPQPIWEAVIDSDPDLWIWTGDIVYPKADSLELLRAAYAIQKKRPEYVRLREQCPIIGVWDDHDYGLDDGGAENPFKRESQVALLDFLDEPADSPRRKQEGVYAKYSYGPASQRVLIILLDTRYHRDAPGKDGDVLGAAQWKWFEQALHDDDAQLTVIVSSIQVIPTEQRFEKWGNFPENRARLLRLIEQSGRDCVLLSGDRHLAEMSDVETSPFPAGYPLIEITSSGLTHSWKDFPGEPNRLREGPVYSDLNFGMIEIDWNQRPVFVTLEVRDVNGRPRLRGVLTLKDRGNRLEPSDSR